METGYFDRRQILSAGKFTTFVVYEWTSTPDNRNMHRNIIFKDSKKVPDLPFTSIESDHPEDLWVWMDGQRRAGNELLAISHNANLSDGIMFPIEVDNKGRPIDAAWAQQRVNNEPLAEMNQLKGTSETHPTLSPNDEFANFEILNYLLGGAQRAANLRRCVQETMPAEEPVAERTRSLFQKGEATAPIGGGRAKKKSAQLSLGFVCSGRSPKAVRYAPSAWPIHALMRRVTSNLGLIVP